MRTVLRALIKWYFLDQSVGATCFGFGFFGFFSMKSCTDPLIETHFVVIEYASTLFPKNV